jgi:hypothetical protein
VCEKCKELDAKIEHYRSLAYWLTDHKTIEGINELIERWKAERATLHSEQKR